MHPRNTFIQLFAVVLAFSATPKLLSEVLATQSVLAQSPSPTSFPLPDSLPSGTAIQVDGSTSMAVINEALKQNFLQKFPGSTVELATTGTDQALQALENGTITLAAVGRPLTDAEKARGLVEVPINREKVAIIVGPDNPFNGDIRFEQFAKIFRGEITDWSELGGPPGPIRLVDRPDFSDTRRTLSQYDVFESAPFQTGPNATQVATDDTAAIIQELGNDGISYAVASQVLGQNNVKIISMHQTLPDDPRYPFSQPRGYVYKAGADPGTLAFIGLATSPAGLAAIQAARVGNVATAASPSPAATASPSPSPDAAVTLSPSPAATLSPSPDAAVAPSPSPEAVAQAPTTTETTTRGGFPWWLLLLPLAGLAWWLLKKRGPAAVATAPAAAPVATAATAAATAAAPIAAPVAAPVTALPASRMVLTPRDCRNAYAYWEVPQARLAELRDQGGRKLALRLYDVTDINMDQQVPHSVKQFDCVDGEPDLHLPVAVDDRDYIAELGYVAADGRWMQIVRAQPVRVPACPVAAAMPEVAAPAVATPAVVPEAAVSTPAPEVAAPAITTPDLPSINSSNNPSINPALAAGAVLAGGAALAGAAIARDGSGAAPAAVAPQSRMILTPLENQTAYAYWEAADVEKTDLKRQGGQQFALRLYDVTGQSVDQPLPEPIEQLNGDDLDQDRHLRLPQPDHDYLAEVGYTTPAGTWLKLAQSNVIHSQPALSLTATSASSTSEEAAPRAGSGAVATDITGAAGIAAGITAVGSAAGLAATPSAEPATEPALMSAALMSAAPMSVAPVPGRCAIKTLTVHSRHNCFLLDDGTMQVLQQQTAVTKTLEPGLYLVRIKSGTFDYDGAGGAEGEPIVLLWIHGGSVINQKTNVPVNATWSTLNGYDETLSLEVQETTTLHAFFFDTYTEDNSGEVTLSVISLPRH